MVVPGSGPTPDRRCVARAPPDSRENYDGIGDHPARPQDDELGRGPSGRWERGSIRSAGQPGEQFRPSPRTEAARPCGLVARVLGDHPPSDLLGGDRQQSADLNGLVSTVFAQSLDDDLFAVAVKSPDLGDLQGGIDSWPVDLRRRDVNFDSQIGVRLFGDFPGSSWFRLGHRDEFFGSEEVALVGLQATSHFGPLPGRLTRALIRNL
jgi:hypothetical protein